MRRSVVGSIYRRSLGRRRILRRSRHVFGDLVRRANVGFLRERERGNTGND
jgi:hypothetical protein